MWSSFTAETGKASGKTSVLIEIVVFCFKTCLSTAIQRCTDHPICILIDSWAAVNSNCLHKSPCTPLFSKIDTYVVLQFIVFV